MKPRKLPPGTYRVWRCTQDGRATLKPIDRVEGTLLYCLISATEKTGSELNALTAALVGYQAMFTVSENDLPILMRDGNRDAANVLKSLFQIRANVWSDGSYAYELLETPERVIEALAEIALAPVADALVARPEQWTGFSSYRMPFGTELEAKRPTVYFDPRGSRPPWVSTTLTKPALLRDLSAEDVQERVEEIVARRAAELRDQLRLEGRKPLGLERAKIADPHLPPRYRPQRGGRKREYPEPYLSQEQRVRRVAPEVLKAWNDFVRRYKEAMKQWRELDREVVFPAGTYWMRVWHHARCEGF